MSLPDPLNLFGPGGLPDPLGVHAQPPGILGAPTREDQSVIDAREKRRLADLKRKGRASTIVTGGSGVTGEAPLSRPEVLGA